MSFQAPIKLERKIFDFLDASLYLG